MTTTKIKKLNPFIINYLGTKYRESIQHFEGDDIDFNKYKSFVEPFGGTFGFSRYIYMKLNKPTDKKFIIYDNDKELITFYNNIKGMTKEEYEELHNKYNEIVNKYDKEEWHKNGFNIIRELKDTIEDKNINFMIVLNNKPNMISRKCNKKANMEWFDMFKYCEFKYMNVVNEYEYITTTHNTKDTIIYLDPPYINNCNEQYADVNIDYSEFIINCFINKKKSNVIFVHERNFLLLHILNKYLYKSYDKLYPLRQRKKIHNVFMKYKV